jgi:hypothetical protein
MSPNEFLELCEMALQCEQQRRFKHLANERADRAEAELAKRGLAMPEDEGSPYSAWMKTAPPEER